MSRHIALVACLHSSTLAHALVYTRVGNSFYRFSKQSNNPNLEWIQMQNHDACMTDARNITRYSPSYELSDSINNAPLTQLQLERLVVRLQAMGGLHDGKQAAQG